MNVNTEAKLRRIAVNLFLDFHEREKLVQMYENGNKNMRDHIVDVVEKQSETRNFEERRRLRQIIRDS